MDTSTHQPDRDQSPSPVAINVTASTAQSITRHFELLDESQPLLNAEQTPAEFLQILMDRGHYYDATGFLAHALPMHEAVWWACVCVREHLDDSDEQYRQALSAAETWVREPTEDNRREAETGAEEGDYKTPASWAAAAAFWSGDNVAPRDKPAMAPPAYQHAKAVAAAIVMSAGLGRPVEDVVAERYQRYLQQGIHIANSDGIPVDD